MVEMRGIEPLTLRMRTVRTTNCATPPRIKFCLALRAGPKAEKMIRTNEYYSINFKKVKRKNVVT